jgi:hypothetical protein
MGKAVLDPFRRRRLARRSLPAYPTKLRGFTTVGRILAFSLAPGVLGAFSAASAASPSQTPYSELEAITAPSRAGSELSLVEWVCRSFAITIDGLSASLSQGLGPWSQSEKRVRSERIPMSSPFGMASR